MNELYDLAFDMVDFLNDEMDIEVQFGYMSASAEIPLKTPKIFVSPIGQKDERVAVAASVYTPSSYGGSLCSDYAQKVFDNIRQPYFPAGVDRKLLQAEIGKIEYNSRLGAFVCVVTIVTGICGAYPFTITEPTGEYFSEIFGSAEKCSIERCFGVERYFEIFDEMPIGVTKEVNTYNIILDHVKIDLGDQNEVTQTELIEKLGECGEFRLTVDGETFDRCICKSAKSSGGSVCVIIHGYGEQSDDGESIEINVH